MLRMLRIAGTLTFGFALLVGAAGCDVTKTENPTSPSVAGPIAGVTISTPTLVAPTAGQKIEVTQLPVTLVVQNSTTNSQRTVKYVFDVASDAAFGSKLIDGVTVSQGDNGQTKYTIDKGLESGKSYYWRVKADDGANQSATASAKDFTVYTLSITAPVLIYPTANLHLASSELPLTVTLQNSITNGDRSLSYLVEVGTDPGFSTKVFTTTVPGGSNDKTTVKISATLEYDRIYYWRARANDGVAQSAYSNANAFVVDSPVVVPPPTSPPPTGGGGNDAIDLSTVTFSVGENISRWAVTSTMISGGWSNNTLCTNHTKAGQWPQLSFYGDWANPVEGNQMVFAKINGKWYGGSGEWLRPGQTCKGVPADMGPDTFYNAPPPLCYWIPQPGEYYGLGVSTPSRAGQWGSAERSNVILVQWK